MRWRGGGEGGGGGGRARAVWSRYQIIVRPSGTQIEEQNCQIRKHVVMQQWNEIDRRQETERGGGGGGRRWSYCYLSDSAAVLQGEGGGAPTERSKLAPNFDATQQDDPSKYPVDAPCLVWASNIQFSVVSPLAQSYSEK